VALAEALTLEGAEGARTLLGRQSLALGRTALDSHLCHTRLLVRPILKSARRGSQRALPWSSGLPLLHERLTLTEWRPSSKNTVRKSLWKNSHKWDTRRRLYKRCGLGGNGTTTTMRSFRRTSSAAGPGRRQRRLSRLLRRRWSKSSNVYTVG